MRFSEQLNMYIKTIKCSNKELAGATGLSEGTISRYRNGVRIPSAESERLKSLAKGLSKLALTNNIKLEEEDIFNTLKPTVDTGLLTDYDTYIFNLKTLLSALDISNTELARELNYDPSYISRILSGKRRPSEFKKFTLDISEYIAHREIKEHKIPVLCSMLACSPEILNNVEDLTKLIEQWLYSTNGGPNEIPTIQSFLEKIDVFDLDEYIKAIHFNDIKLPAIPFNLPTTKHYTGLDEMMSSELDFIKATVMSKSMDDVILYSDMPMAEMAKDEEFPKKWMFGMAMLLKKGLHLNIIHDVNRPLSEMFLGLESHIPMYMTGQISPYYLDKSQGNVFHHRLMVSGAAALSGEAISGYHSKGRYTLTKNKEEVRYYRLRGKHLLNNALPLMQIYRSDRSTKFEKNFLSLVTSENCKMISNSLPLFTLSEGLLIQILKDNSVSDTDIDKITEFHKKYLLAINRLLKNYQLAIEVPYLTEQEFSAGNWNLGLSEMFYEHDVSYSYEQYKAHLEQTQDFCDSFDNCILELNSTPTFKNISFSILGDKCVIVSKNKLPAIHFIIHHPKMVQAFKSFVPPVIEEN